MPVHEPELDSDGEDCVDAVEESDVTAISEVVRKMDKIEEEMNEVEEECSESGLNDVDSVYASEFE
jgi:hypothetical protein